MQYVSSSLLCTQTIQQTVQSHESAVKSVTEKGEALLDTVNDPTISENMRRLQADYQDLCLAAKVFLTVSYLDITNITWNEGCEIGPISYILIIACAIFIIIYEQTLKKSNFGPKPILFQA